MAWDPHSQQMLSLFGAMMVRGPPQQPPDETGLHVAPMVAQDARTFCQVLSHFLGGYGSHTRRDGDPEHPAQCLHSLNCPNSHCSMACVLERCWVPAELDSPEPACSVRTLSSGITAQGMFQEHWRRGHTESEPHAASGVHSGEGKTWAGLLESPRGRVTARAHS